MEKQAYVYIVTNRRNGTIYIGVTSDLIQRIYQHREKLVEGFSKTHNLNQLVWYKQCPDIDQAIQLEKQMKKWKRLWKLHAIEEMNPDWIDLYDSLA